MGMSKICYGGNYLRTTAMMSNTHKADVNMLDNKTLFISQLLINIFNIRYPWLNSTSVAILHIEYLACNKTSTLLVDHLHHHCCIMGLEFD